MSGTWGSPRLPSGLDQYTAKQEPRVEPCDDLSRFVLDRIREAETEPRADQIPQNHNKRGEWPIAYRYAGYVRDDMVAFRCIVAQYVEAHAIPLDIGLDLGRKLQALKAVQSIAMRWSQHPDMRDEWRLE